MAHEPGEFERVGRESSGGLFSEYWAFLHHNQKWWLLPILLVLFGFGLLLLFSTSAAAPFIYTLF